MTQFDESKHKRAQDGKFAHKPHSEAAGVDLTAQGFREPATSPIEGYMGAAAWEGNKYAETRGLNVVELAKLVRQDLKDATKAGWLPEGIKYSVRTRHGNVIDLVGYDLPPDREVYDYWVTDGPDGKPESRRQMKPEYQQAKKRLDLILRSYDYHAGNVYADYHDSRFYGFASLRDEHANTQHKELAANEKVRAATSQVQRGVEGAEGRLKKAKAEQKQAAEAYRQVEEWNAAMREVVRSAGTHDWDKIEKAAKRRRDDRSK